MSLSSISTVNLLPPEQKRKIYQAVIPKDIYDLFNLPKTLVDSSGNDLLGLKCPEGTSSVEMSLFHRHDFPDPVLYGHLTDTLNGQVHILLYILNDPNSPRYDVDRMPDGTPTHFGTSSRNLEAEAAALRDGLAPGQVRRGLRLLKDAVASFEEFVRLLGHDIYFVEPLYYHNAFIFERYGFTYQTGRKLMERINAGLTPGGDLIPLLDDSTPFRQPAAIESVRLRSWAIHDGILGEPFTNVTMYKRVGMHAGISTCPDCRW
jgi:hypothetical protein